MIHNPKQRIAKLWKQLRAESDWDIEVYTVTRLPGYKGGQVRFQGFGNLKHNMTGRRGRIRGMWVRGEFPEIFHPVTFSAEERMLTRTLARLRKVKA